MTQNSFSSFPQDEQRNGLELEAFRLFYVGRKAVLETHLKDSKARLEALPIVNEFSQLAKRNLDESARRELDRAFASFEQMHREASSLAVGEIDALEQEWNSRQARLNQYSAVMHAVRVFKDERGIAPIVDPELPAPQELNSGIYAYEDLVFAELEKTREVLSQHAPYLLGSYQFRSSELSLEDGGGGLAVEQAADILLACRIKLRALRAPYEDGARK